jgi:hypothetical protein
MIDVCSLTTPTQQARHEEMTKHHALERQIREIEHHYEHIPQPMKNVGNAEERKVS